MNIIDVVIILLIGGCTLLGIKRGFTKELFSALGFFLVVVLAFLLKNPVSAFFYEHFPFMQFSGLFKGITVLNVLFYEILAFFLVLSILTVILKVLTFISAVFEKLLTMTIILGIPSKILGAIIGAMEGIVWSFLLVYFLCLPPFQITTVNKSKGADLLFHHVPVLNHMTKEFVDTIQDLNTLKEDYKKAKNADQFNYQALDLFLKNRVISIESVIKLEKKGKLQFKGIKQLIQKYKEERK